MEPEINYRMYKSSPIVIILSQINPAHDFQAISLRSILLLPSHLRLRLPSGLFPSPFPTKSSILFPVRATKPSHLILRHLITRIILSELCKLRSASLCSLCSPMTRLSAHYSQRDKPILFCRCERPSVASVQNEAKL
jgi:hypothetical protein